MIDYLDPQLFTWSRWRVRSISDLGLIRVRMHFLLDKKITLNRYAVGYCKGENLVCRPKINHTAVMFFKECHFWFHLRNEEFDAIFKA
jgi:hypothetical protein